MGAALEMSPCLFMYDAMYSHSMNTKANGQILLEVITSRPKPADLAYLWLRQPCHGVVFPVDTTVMLESILRIGGSTIPTQIFEAIVSFPPVIMASLHAIGAWANKCLQYQSVDTDPFAVEASDGNARIALWGDDVAQYAGSFTSPPSVVVPGFYPALIRNLVHRIGGKWFPILSHLASSVTLWASIR